MAIMPSKMVYGDQIQIRLDPAQLEAKNRKQWGDLYLANQAEKARLFVSASSYSAAAIVSSVAAVNVSSAFAFVAIVLVVLSSKAFFDFGYKKGILDDWESKTMVRMDK